MAKKRTLRAPTTSSLPNNLRIPSNTPSLVKAFGRLSRQSLLNLVAVWLSPKIVELYPPFLENSNDNDGLNDQDESPYPAASSVEEIREAYEELRQRKGGKREVIDRVLEGDWRHGIALGQLAMVDIQHLEDHPRAQTWSAFRLGLVDKKRQLAEKEEDGDLLATLPRLHAATFLSNLQREISPLVKAHYHLARSKSYPLIYLRLFITDSPYHQPRQGPGTYLDAARILYIAFPDSSPYIYTSMSALTGSKTGPSQSAVLMNDPRTLRGIVRDALPKALSKQNERYTLEATSLTAKSLETMLALRGAGRTNEANGAFSIFGDAVFEGTPVDPRQPTTVVPQDYQTAGSASEDKENATDQQDLNRKGISPSNGSISSPATKRRKLAVLSRFGTSGTSSSQATLNRLDIRLLDHLDDDDNDETNANEEGSDDDDSTHTMSLSFTGNNVIAGFRKLAELGVVDPNRMPSWMTGEEGGDGSDYQGNWNYQGKTAILVSSLLHDISWPGFEQWCMVLIWLGLLVSLIWTIYTRAKDP
ncbi:CHL4 family chromosome segregation protein, putative [Talaromyces stipitatus ATCC 10500]|uniref:CHL4 family chromosome segregation protein, putative n=1 Tax=Talaromyces stipitatus (strain ATCC 10500 / CBS 375.48 / QM 6759 / NRRL 1006) TaxID=441959 RepID=B8LUC4_TALSN|nr:CHL4 family chromosome segregation protein, putative [Talaromyces stipitatus ATCC 10500]EED23697.1 CHL4 family chromosome segregation protein, putative [Talaromyces stipitatus ATCC 10500]